MQQKSVAMEISFRKPRNAFGIEMSKWEWEQQRKTENRREESEWTKEWKK